MSVLRIPSRPERIKVFLRDPDKKPLLYCLFEFIKLSAAKKEIAYYYFKHLYKKQLQNIEDYLSTNERARIHRSELNRNYEYISILNNKVNFAIYFQKFQIRTPRLLGYNIEDHFYNGSIFTKVDDVEATMKFFIKLFESSRIGEIFIRPISALGGEGCIKLNAENLDPILKEAWETLRKGSYIYTEVISQHPSISVIHPYSVNTIRFLTLVPDSGKPELISAAMRFGASEKVVDNVTAGGFFVGVDLETGILKKYGWREDLINRGELQEFHPLSGVKLEGFKIPFFSEACSLVLEATKYLPKKLIGWDVAIGMDGPILIEGNHDPGLTMPDLANEGLLNNPNFRRFVQQVNKS